MAEKLRTLIVDDEAPARANIQLLLEKQNSFELVGMCADGISAIEKIKELRPDIIFLDIQMPEVDGFEVLRQLSPEERPYVIFVTAFDQYAVKAFEVNALDYLLKPFDDRRFKEAAQRVLSRWENKSLTQLNNKLSKLLQDMPRVNNKFLTRISVRQGSKVLFVPTSEIIWFEAENQYVTVHTKTEKHLIRTSMRQLEESLDPMAFYRAHRSAIVRLDAIVSMEPHFKGDYLLGLSTSAQVKLSRNRVQGLKDHFKTT